MPLYFHIIKVSYAVTSNLMSKKKMKKKKKKQKAQQQMSKNSKPALLNLHYEHENRWEKEIQQSFKLHK